MSSFSPSPLDDFFGGDARRVAAVLRARYGNAIDLEEVMQEAAIRAFLNLHRYDPNKCNSRFDAWFMTIADRVALSQIRKRRIRLRAVESKSPSGETETYPAPEHNLELAEDLAKLQVALERLTDREFFVVSRRMENWSHAEIAESLKMQPNTVAALFHRAKKTLLKFMSDP